MILSVMAMAFLACNPETKQANYTLENLSFEFEGPLFEGPNTGQYTLEVQLDKVMEGLASETAKVRHARLNKAVIRPGEGSDFSLINSLVLQLASDDAEMMEIGVLNPVPEGSNEAELNASTEADVADFFNGKSFILVLDAGLKEDLYDNMILKGTFEFSLEIQE